MSILQRIVEVMEEEIEGLKQTIKYSGETNHTLRKEVDEALKLVAQKETAVIYHMEQNNKLLKEIKALKKELGKDTGDGLKGL